MFDIKFKKFTTDFHIHIEDENLFFDELEIHNIINSFESIFSRFNEESVISILNKEKKLIVPDIFLKLYNQNLFIYNLTDLYFNPLINIDNIWYKSLSNNKNINKGSLSNIDLENVVEINENKLELKKDVSLDFWWSAKWYLVDIITYFIKSKWHKNFFVNFGWDIYISWHKKNNDNYIIWISDPNNINHDLLSIELSNCSISTSWIYKRKWKENNTNHHHIINPKTILNNFDILSVSIIWENTFFTDSIATSIISMWFDKWLDFLNKNNIYWIIITDDNKIHLTKDFIKKYNIYYS